MERRGGDSAVQGARRPETDRHQQALLHGLHLRSTVDGIEAGDLSGRRLGPSPDDVQSGDPGLDGTAAVSAGPERLCASRGGLQRADGQEAAGRRRRGGGAGGGAAAGGGEQGTSFSDCLSDC